MADQIGPWRLTIDPESNERHWVNTETGEQFADTPEIRSAIEGGATTLYNQGQAESPNINTIWNPVTGQFDPTNPYTTQRATFEKMLITSGPNAGKYRYFDDQGNSEVGLQNFNRMTGGKYTEDQFKKSDQTLDPVRGNDDSSFASQFGDVVGDVLRGVLGFVSGGTSELILGLSGMNDDSAESKRQARAGMIGSIAGSLFGSGTGGENGSSELAPVAGGEEGAAEVAPNTGLTTAGEGAASEMAPTTTTQATGLSSSAAQTGGVAETPGEALAPAPAPTTPSATPTTPSSSPSLLDQALKYAKDNKELTSGLMQIGGGLLKGIGENKQQDKKIQAQKDLENQKLQNQMELQNFLRRFTQSGSYFDSALPFKPGAPVLRRPGGQPVYTSTGLIAAGTRR